MRTASAARWAPGIRLRIGLFSYQVPVDPPAPVAPVAKSGRQEAGTPS